MPKTWQENGSLYNPINCEITDQKRLYEYDLKEKNKRKRYELRYDMERQIRKEGLSEEERVKMIGLNKINYKKFIEPLERGFDILTNKKFNDPKDKESKQLFEPNVVKPVKVWSKIMDSSAGFQEPVGEINEKVVPEAAKTDTEFWNKQRQMIERRS